MLSIRDAVYGENDTGPVGEPRKDDRNPNAAERSRPVVGIDLLSDYAYDDGLWKGRIYDPESGKVYSSHMKIGKAGQLEMRGYIGVPWVGRTALFDPVASCLPHIVAMLATIDRQAPCG
ncbi:MAG: DUF2147 domain-containing protein [Gammaproteobacteria bacterium]|nr:DUF2147 domain-containing protein [Gammaproteobacteria bacterium]